MPEHRLTFEKNNRTNMWRATCTCGWRWIDIEGPLKARAAGHDTEWEVVDTTLPQS